MKKIPVCLSIILICFFSCRKPTISGGGPDVVPDVKIRYVDSMDNDIFSPSHDGQNGYWMDSVRIYDYENRTKTLIYQAPTGAATYDSPYGYVFTTFANISNIQGEYMTVFANNDVVNRYSNSIINLKDGVYDTLRVHLTGDIPFGTDYDSVWYNSVYIPGIDPIFTIVK